MQLKTQRHQTRDDDFFFEHIRRHRVKHRLKLVTFLKLSKKTLIPSNPLIPFDTINTFTVSPRTMKCQVCPFPNRGRQFSAANPESCDSFTQTTDVTVVFDLCVPACDITPRNASLAVCSRLHDHIWAFHRRGPPTEEILGRLRQRVPSIH